MLCFSCVYYKITLTLHQKTKQEFNLRTAADRVNTGIIDMLLENLAYVSHEVHDDGEHVDFRLMDDLGREYVACCSFEGETKKYGRTYRDGLAVSPAEESFTCTKINFEYAYDANSDEETDEYDIEGDFNEFCDLLSYIEIE